MSGYGILFRGVHQAVQGTALGVAVIFGLGEAAPLQARELVIVQPPPYPAIRQSTAMARVLVLTEGRPIDRAPPFTAAMARAARSEESVLAIPLLAKQDNPQRAAAPAAVEVHDAPPPPSAIDWDAPPQPAKIRLADRAPDAAAPISFQNGAARAAHDALFPAMDADVAAPPWLGGGGARRQALMALEAAATVTPPTACGDCTSPADGKTASKSAWPTAQSELSPHPVKATKHSRASRAGAKSMPIPLIPAVSARFARPAIVAFDAPALPTDMVKLACVVAAQNRMGPPCFAVDGTKPTGRRARADMRRFPAFDGDVSAAPWLGDPRPRRSALGVPPADDPEYAAAAEELEDEARIAPDLATGVDGADGQANETDLLSIKTLPRGGLAFSGGYSSLEGPIGTVKIARTNIGAPGRDITASARYSKIQRLVEFGVADANFVGSKIAIAPTFFYSRSSAVGFDEQSASSVFRQTSRGLNLYLGKALGRGLRVAANYRFADEDFLIRQKNAQCDVGLHGSAFCNALGVSTSSVVSVAVSLDRRNSTVDPTRGFQLRLTQDVAGPGGTTRYARTRIAGSFHHRLSDNIDASLGVEGGWMKAIGGRDIPLFDRFYIGGNSMRGFDLRGIGPKVVPLTAPPGQTTAIGGRAYYVGRLEVSFRLDGTMEKFGVSPSVFVDAGSVFGASKDELIEGERLIGNSAKPRVVVGVGLAFNAGPGKLRFNLAQPVVRQEGDRAKSFSITLGTAF